VNGIAYHLWMVYSDIIGQPSFGAKVSTPSAREPHALKLALLQAGSAWSRDYLVRMKRVVDMIPRLVTAIATALVVGTMAHKYAGLSLDTIRTDALSTAGVIFAAVACGSLLKPK
jgi:hypothetical protein